VSCLKFLWFVSVENPKSKIYSNKPHTLDEFKHGICEAIISVEVSELNPMAYNHFARLENYLRAGGRYFEHPL
jgi:hypothetical protein